MFSIMLDSSRFLLLVKVLLDIVEKLLFMLIRLILIRVRLIISMMMLVISGVISCLMNGSMCEMFILMKELVMIMLKIVVIMFFIGVFCLIISVLLVISGLMKLKLVFWMINSLVLNGLKCLYWMKVVMLEIISDIDMIRLVLCGDMFSVWQISRLGVMIGMMIVSRCWRVVSRVMGVLGWLFRLQIRLLWVLVFDGFCREFMVVVWGKRV